MHTPRYIYREGKGIFKREDLRRTLREAAASNVASRIRDSRGDARESISDAVVRFVHTCKSAPYPVLQYLSPASREKSTSMREYSARSRRPHFSFNPRRGIYGALSGDQHPAGARARKNIIPRWRKGEKRAARDASSASQHTRAFDNRPGHWGRLPSAQVATGFGSLRPPLFRESALMVPRSRAESGDELPERAVSAETVCGEKRLYRLLEQAANSE